MKKFSWILTGLLSIGFILPAVSHAAEKKKRYRNDLATASTPFAGAFSLQQIVADMNRRAVVGVVVRSLQTGKSLYDKNAAQVFTPASNMKVITAFAALKFLGPDFIYRTRLMTDTPGVAIENGVLKGNLYLKYDGDPTLDLDDLNNLFGQLSQKGIRAIQGNFYVDTSLYDTQGVAPGTEAKDQGYCYGAPVGAAILNRNCLTFKLYPGQIGAPARLSLPYGINLPIVNSVVTSSGRSCALRAKQSGNGKLVLDGCVSSRRRSVDFTVPIPANCGYGEVAASTLLSRNGIKALRNNLPTYQESDLYLIAEHTSKPLADLVLQMMKKSDNLIANTLFKTIGAKYNHQPATWQNSGNAVMEILKKNDIDVTKMRAIDGSGLSRDNRVTPDQLAQVLIAAQKDPVIANVYLKALPVGGLNGTLKYRLGTKDVIGKVKAKTGSMHGISSLSGYVETQSGEILVFSIIVNDFVGGLYQYRAMEDKLCRVLRARY